MSLRDLGLYLLAIGVCLLIAYGIYKILPIFAYIDPLVLISLIAIFIGVVLIIISIIKEKGKEKEGISKEDLEP